MGIFGQRVKLNEARVSGGGIYFLPGLYEVRIEACKIVGERGKKYFLLETFILKSNNPERPAGSRCNWMVNLDLEAAPGNILGLMIAANGLDADSPKDAKAIGDEDWDAVAEEAVGGDNPLKGELLEIEAFYRDKKKKPGEVYTHMNWRPLLKETANVKVAV